jgi:hypothetical protein
MFQRWRSGGLDTPPAPVYNEVKMIVAFTIRDSRYWWRR